MKFSVLEPGYNYLCEIENATNWALKESKLAIKRDLGFDIPEVLEPYRKRWLDADDFFTEGFLDFTETKYNMMDALYIEVGTEWGF